MRHLLFLGFFGCKMLNEMLHDPYSSGSSLEFHSVRYTYVALHAAMFIFINFICAVLLYIIYFIDYRFFYIGFSFYMTSWHGYNLFAFRFGSDEAFTFEYWPRFSDPWFSGPCKSRDVKNSIPFPVLHCFPKIFAFPNSSPL